MSYFNTGYVIAYNEDYNLWVIQKKDESNIFATDEEAAKAYVAEGGKLFTTMSKLLGIYIIKNDQNLDVLRKAHYSIEVIENNCMHEYFYIKSLLKDGRYAKTMNIDNAKKLKATELEDCIKEVEKRHKKFSKSFTVLGVIR